MYLTTQHEIQMLEEQINSSRKKDKWGRFTAFTEMHKAYGI